MGHLGLIKRGEGPSRWAARPGSSPERLVASGMTLIGACIIGLIGTDLYRLPAVRTWSSDDLIAASAGVPVATGYGLIGWFGT